MAFRLPVPRYFLSMILLASGIILRAENTESSVTIILKNQDRLTGKLVEENRQSIILQHSIFGRMTIAKDQITSRSELSAPSSVSPIDDIPEKSRIWSGSVQAGATLTRGNNNTLDAQVTAKAQRELLPWRTHLEIRGNQGRSREITNRENIEASAKQDYFFENDLYAYLQGNALNDRFRNIRLRLEGGPGVGREWLHTTASRLLSEAGFLFSHEDRIQGEDDTHAFGRLSAEIEHRFDSRLTGRMEMTLLPSLEDPLTDYRFNGKMGLDLDLPYSLLLSFELMDEFNNTVSPGVQKNDIRISQSIGFRF